MKIANLMEHGRAVARHPKPETYKETVDDLAAAKSLIGRLTDALEAAHAVQQPNREALADKLEVAIADWDHRMHMDQPTRPLADELADVVFAAPPIPATGEAETLYLDRFTIDHAYFSGIEGKVTSAVLARKTWNGLGTPDSIRVTVAEVTL